MVSGSIAAFKACQVVSRLVQEGHEVYPVLSAGGARFVGAATLEGLCGRPVLTDLWGAGRAMDHIHLTRQCDVAVLCPASANRIAKLAHGMADDAISAIGLAWPIEKPFLVIPAMNSHMLKASATQDNLATLRARGLHVTGTGRGTLACGELGDGRLLEPEAIYRLVSRHLTRGRSTPPRGRVLITSGATREFIDGIRFLSNVSTGQTGAQLADLLSARGWQVTQLHGQGAPLAANAERTLNFVSVADLDAQLRSELQSQAYQAVIHAAAVSDYQVRAPELSVKPSAREARTLDLQLTPKLLPKLKSYAGPNTWIIGFKLTLNAAAEETQQRAQELLGREVDAVVANDWSDVTRDRDRHPGWLVRPEGRVRFETLTELADVLDQQLPAVKGRL